MNRSFVVSIPASTANIGPGFDTFGCAVNLYLKIKVNYVKENFVETNDLYNFIYKCIYYYFLRCVNKINTDQAKLQAFNCEIVKENIPIKFFLDIENEIPISAGLGSSAACIVGSIIICNELFNLGLSKDDMFKYSLELENHPDNIGACLFGSLFVAMKNDDNSYNYHLLKLNPDIKFLCIVPETTLSTDFSRSLLPTNYSINDTIYNLQHSCSLLLSLTNETLNPKLIYNSLKDKMHQPYRTLYTPGFNDILNSINVDNTPGVLGVTLSGAGPSIIILYYDNVFDIMNKVMNILNNVKYKPILLIPDYTGATGTYF